MNGRKLRTRSRLVARTTVAIAALALAGFTAASRAEQAELVQSTAVAAQPTGPVFVPSEAAFAGSFADYDTPAAPVAQGDAVDITTITPAEAPDPAATVTRDLGTGIASYYGRGFAGRPTANGERFNPAHLTAAHRTLPFGTRVRVTNPRNGQSVVVRINDRGPFIAGRTIDLSQGAAERIGLVSAGHGSVRLEVVQG